MYAGMEAEAPENLPGLPYVPCGILSSLSSAKAGRVNPEGVCELDSLVTEGASGETSEVASASRKVRTRPEQETN